MRGELNSLALSRPGGLEEDIPFLQSKPIRIQSFPEATRRKQKNEHGEQPPDPFDQVENPMESEPSLFHPCVSVFIRGKFQSKRMESYSYRSASMGSNLLALAAG